MKTPSSGFGTYGTNLPTYLLTYLPTYLLNYLLTDLLTDLLTYLPTYLALTVGVLSLVLKRVKHSDLHEEFGQAWQGRGTNRDFQRANLAQRRHPKGPSGRSMGSGLTGGEK